MALTLYEVSKAYDWAFVNPLRKIFYNIAITTVSVAVALLIGTIQLLQIFIDLLHLEGRFFAFVAGIDFGTLGYLIFAVFVTAWGGSMALWKFGRIEERRGHLRPLHTHEHTHASGVSHSHKHFH